MSVLFRSFIDYIAVDGNRGRRFCQRECVTRTMLHIWTTANYVPDYVLAEMKVTGIIPALSGAFNTPEKPLMRYKKHLPSCVRSTSRDNILIITSVLYSISRIFFILRDGEEDDDTYRTSLRSIATSSMKFYDKGLSRS